MVLESKLVRPTGLRYLETDAQALSSALAALGSLQPRAFGSLNTIDPSISVQIGYLYTQGLASETRNWPFSLHTSGKFFLSVYTHNTSPVRVLLSEQAFLKLIATVIESGGTMYT